MMATLFSHRRPDGPKMLRAKLAQLSVLSQAQHYYLIWSIAVVCVALLGVRVQKLLRQGHDVTGIEYRADRSLLHFDDRSDYQWFNFREQLPTTLLIILVHICCTHIVDKAVKYRRTGRAIFQLIAGLACVFYLHGVDWLCAVALVLLYFGISRLDDYQRTRPHTIVVAWSTTILILVCTSFFTDKSTWLLPWKSKDTPPRYPLNRALNLLLLRLISFVSDRHWAICPPAVQRAKSPTPSQARLRMGQLIVSRSRQTSEYSLLNLGAYAFFIPLYVAGPVITFNSFAHNLNVVSRPRSSWVGRRFWMLIAYLLITEFLFTRATLPSAWLVIPENQRWYGLFQLRELMMLGGCLLVYTWIKFKFLWALFRFWSMTTGFYCQENLPDFVFETYSVQSFWKRWHVSFHSWLVRYLYIPMGGAQRRLLSTLTTFVFTALWHQINLDFSAWLLLTAATFVLELGIQRALSLDLARKPLSIKFPTATIAACTLIDTLIAIANLIGFGCGVSGLSLFMRMCLRRPVEALVAWTLYLSVAAFHVSYLLRRDCGDDLRPHSS